MTVRYPGCPVDRARSGHGFDPQRMTAAPCRGWPASGPGRLRPGPWFLAGVSAETSGVKHDFACTFTRQLLLSSLPCRLQSCLRLEGRTRTLRRPSPDLSLALARAPSRHRHRTRIARRAARSLTMVRLRPSRKDPGGGAAPIACTSGWDVPVNEAARARQVQVRENQRESPLRAVALRPVWHEVRGLEPVCPLRAVALRSGWHAGRWP